MRLTPICAATTPEIAAQLFDWGVDASIWCYAGEFVKCSDYSWYGIDDYDAMTPMSCAAVHGHDIVRLLLARGIPLGTQPLRLMAMR